MNLPNLPTQDSATGRGIKTALQAAIAGILVFGSGLIGVINSVPGCKEAVNIYFLSNVVQLAGLFGIGAGLVSFVWNYFRKSVPNY